MRTAPILVLGFLFASAAFAQGPATGRPPFGSFQEGEFDLINLYNLNVNLAIPIVSVPGRGLGFNYAIVYDSSVWKKVYVSGTGWAWRPVTDDSGSPTWGWKRTTLTGSTTYSKTWDYVCDRWSQPLQDWIPVYGWT